MSRLSLKASSWSFCAAECNDAVGGGGHSIVRQSRAIGVGQGGLKIPQS